MRHLSCIMLLAVLATGCAGDGCTGNLPAGFLAGERMTGGIQLQISSAGFRSLEQAVKTILPPRLTVAVQPSCEGDLEVCCDLPAGSCTVALDLEQRPGEEPRLEIQAGQSTGSTLAATMRMRVKSGTRPLVVRKDGLFGGTCEVSFDTERSGEPDITASVALQFATDAVTGTTRLGVASFAVDGLDSRDIDVRGDGFACELADSFKGIAIRMISEQLQSQAGSVVDEQLCTPCSSNDQCAPYGTCSAEGMCMVQGTDRCMQQIGIASRLPAAFLHPALDSGSALDLSLIAGGRTGISGGALSLDLAPGIRPAAPGMLTCGPSSPPPPMPEGGIPSMPALAGSSGAAELSLGLHTAFLDRIAWAVYESGLLCVTLDSSSFPILDSNALSVLIPSIADLTRNGASQVAVTMRPQLPPTIRVGERVPLEIVMRNLVMDYFLLVDDRFVRLFTASTDLSVPLDMETNAQGGLQPVVGDIGQTFTNVVVHKTGMIEEHEELIAARMPVVGTLTSTFLTQLLGSMRLPNLAGLALHIPANGMRSVGSGQFLGIAASIRMPDTTSRAARRLADTEARVEAVHVPPLAAYAELALDKSVQPTIELALGGSAACGSELEWQVRLNRGPWSRYRREPRVVLAREELWLAGRHEIEVRARCAGIPESADPTPVVLAVDMIPEGVELLPSPVAAAAVQAAVPAGEQAPAATARPASATESRAAAGGGCSTTGHTGTPAWLLGMCALVLVRRRSARAQGAAARISVRSAGLASMIALAGCGVGYIEERALTRTEVFGRYSDIAAEGGRVLVSTYEGFYGDLVVGEVDANGRLSLRAIDGVPAAQSASGRAAHRGGVSQPGEDVGAWTSLALAGGLGRVAYQHREQQALRFALEDATGTWNSHEVDRIAGGAVGMYSSLAISPEGIPGIAYMASGVPDGAGGVLAQLRWAQASTPTPSTAADWSIQILAQAPAPAPASAPTPAVADLPAGTGLFASAAWLADGRVAIAFYDRGRGDLMLAVRESAWSIVPLDADPAVDAGRFASLAAAADGTIHVAYHDATGGQLRYVTYSNGAASQPEIADSGSRQGMQHTVGASAALVLDATGNPVVIYQDQFDVALAQARRDATGQWQHKELVRDSMGHGFHVAAVRTEEAIWISSLAYDWTLYPPETLITTSIPGSGSL